MNDAFISYAHIDDQSLSEDYKGWISQLHRALEVRIGQLLGEDPKIWRDPKLQRNQVFDISLVREFLDSKVMISVFSPRYAKSDWCRREFEEFCKHADSQGGLRVGDKSRVFKVVKTPVDPGELTPGMKELYETILGFDFFEQDAQTGRIREYDEAFGEQARQRYFERIYDLAQEICGVIRSMSAGQSPVQAQAGGKTVYLAATTSDQTQNRDQLRRELLSKGHTVLPDCPLPMVDADLRAMVRDMLARSDYAIHPIGTVYGMIPEGGEQSVVEVQNSLAAAASSDGLKRIIWLPDGREANDARQADLIKRLLEDSDVHCGAELVCDSLENLKDLLQKRLRPPEPVLKVVESSNDGSSTGSAGETRRGKDQPPLVYLLCDPADEEAIEPLEDWLFDQGFEVSHPDFEADDAEAAEQHRENLCACDAVLVFYGNARQAWVDIKLRGLSKAVGYGR